MYQTLDGFDLYQKNHLTWFFNAKNKVHMQIPSKAIHRCNGGLSHLLSA